MQARPEHARLSRPHARYLKFKPKRDYVKETQRRAELHLTPFFEGWLMANITTTDVRKYIVQRQSHRSQGPHGEDG